MGMGMGQMRSCGRMKGFDLRHPFPLALSWYNKHRKGMIPVVARRSPPRIVVIEEGRRSHCWLTKPPYWRLFSWAFYFPFMINTISAAKLIISDNASYTLIPITPLRGTSSPESSRLYCIIDLGKSDTVKQARVNHWLLAASGSCQLSAFSYQLEAGSWKLVASG